MFHLLVPGPKGRDPGRVSGLGAKCSQETFAIFDKYGKKKIKNQDIFKPPWHERCFASRR